MIGWQSWSNLDGSILLLNLNSSGKDMVNSSPSPESLLFLLSERKPLHTLNLLAWFLTPFDFRVWVAKGSCRKLFNQKNNMTRCVP